MSKKRSSKVPTQDSFRGENAADYTSARWMERIQKASTRRALDLLVDERIGGAIDDDDTRDGIVLDAGCGNGFSTEMILERGFKVVVGIDISPDMLALRHLPNPVILADMGRLPFRNGTFFVVISISAMNFLSQELDDPTKARMIYDRFAKQLNEIMVPGGRGVIEFYPKTPSELEIITKTFGSRAGFQGFLVIDKPGTRKEQKFLIFRK
nr:class I SAM-dependent methyltransferase [Candidatus Sigynarchaeota archaeon]